MDDEIANAFTITAVLSNSLKSPVGGGCDCTKQEEKQVEVTLSPVERVRVELPLGLALFRGWIMQRVPPSETSYPLFESARGRGRVRKGDNASTTSTDRRPSVVAFAVPTTVAREVAGS